MDNNGVNDENAPKENAEILKMLNNVDRNELECPIPTEENPHLTYEFCAKNRLDSSSLQDVPLQHVHNLEAAHTLSYHTPDDLQHAEIIATYKTKDIKSVQKSPEFTSREMQ